MRYLVLLCLLLLGCASSKSFTGVGHYTPKQKEYLQLKYWTEAQELLEEKTEGQSMFVPVSIVSKWIWTRTVLAPKGYEDVPAFGRCTVYRDNQHVVRTFKIALWTPRPWTIKHEACHAILVFLNYKDWVSYCHKEGVFK